VLVRVVSTLVLAPLVLGAAFFGGALWSSLVAAACLLALHEAIVIARACGRRPDRVVAFPLAGALVLVPSWAPGLGGGDAVLGLLALGVAGAFLAQIARAHGQRAVEDWAVTLALAVYVGSCGGLAVALRHGPAGAAWVIALLLLTWLNDSLAFLVGRQLGRHPMAPRISPKKTWEGFAGATIGTMAAAAALPAFAAAVGGALAPLADLAPASTLLLGAGLALVGPLGDLSKSLLKRQAGVKDSGHLIPGHGGMLDRTDSLLLGAALVWWASLLLGR